MVVLPNPKGAMMHTYKRDQDKLYLLLNRYWRKNIAKLREKKREVLEKWEKEKQDLIEERRQDLTLIKDLASREAYHFRRRHGRTHCPGDEDITGYAHKIGKYKASVLDSMDENLHFDEMFNLRGALDRIAFHAVLERKIVHGGDTKEKLDLISKTEEFKEILAEEVYTRGLLLDDVQACIGKLYDRIARNAQGNTAKIEINREHFKAEEVAALVAFFRLQEEWGNSIKWEEI
ncbi:hypothetical protein BDZ91DRAFT_785683 [Kalaharituber pfeilii]|nr:hypothetical protein BDZ91DRAFT_785683 [Kalaharituber pfeilii]